MDLRPPTTFAWDSLRVEGRNSGVLLDRFRDHPEIQEHDHLFHEIVYVESGTAEHRTADGSRRLRPGDLILIRPQVWHAYRRCRGLDIINCLIDSRLMQRLDPLLAPVQGAFDLFRRRLPRPREVPPIVLHATPAQRSGLLQRLEQMLAEQREQSNGWQTALTSGLLDVLVNEPHDPHAHALGEIAAKVTGGKVHALSERLEARRLGEVAFEVGRGV